MYLDQWGWEDVAIMNVEQMSHIVPNGIDEYLQDNINLPSDSADYLAEMEKLRGPAGSDDVEYLQEDVEDGVFDD